MRLSFLKRLLSYLYPVKVKKSASAVNPVLELFYYQGQWQLATEDAVYSDGTRYRPLTLAFQKLKKELPNVQNILVLGTGLGSAVTILDQMKLHPSMTLVELDAQIIKWTKETLPQHLLPQLKFICDDAALFMEKNQERYDLVIVDIFNSRIVPAFVMTEKFLAQCKNALNKNGRLVLNYIINQKENWETSQENFSQIFPNHTIYESGLNRIFIARN